MKFDSDSFYDEVDRQIRITHILITCVIVVSLLACLAAIVAGVYFAIAIFPLTL